MRAVKSSCLHSSFHHRQWFLVTISLCNEVSGNYCDHFTLLYTKMKSPKGNLWKCFGVLVLWTMPQTATFFHAQCYFDMYFFLSAPLLWWLTSRKATSCIGPFDIFQGSSQNLILPTTNPNDALTIKIFGVWICPSIEIGGVRGRGGWMEMKSGMFCNFFPILDFVVIMVCLYCIWFLQLNVRSPF